MMRSLTVWLSHTQLSGVLQETGWLIPLIQTIHILAIAVVISSALFVDLRLLGLFAKAQPTVTIANRLLPWTWGSMVILAASGALLLVAEPDRSLGNPAFEVKLLLLLNAILATTVIQSGLRRDSAFWDQTTVSRVAGRTLAGASFLLWSGVVLAGRLIAYTGPT
jgi:hypothetical protein